MHHSSLTDHSKAFCPQPMKQIQRHCCLLFAPSIFSSSSFPKVQSAAAGEDGFCSAPAASASAEAKYWKFTSSNLAPSHLQDFPGFTRSVYKRDHAAITPESHVFGPLPHWENMLEAYLGSLAMGSHELAGRAADRWLVQASDAIWMTPFVPQWYVALGKTRSRYLLYKDVTQNPL